MFLRQAPEAIRAFSQAVRAEPGPAGAAGGCSPRSTGWSGNTPNPQIAAQHVAKLESLAPEVVTARSMLADGNLPRGGGTPDRRYLRRAPTDIEAMRVLAQVAHQNEFSKDAAILLEAVIAAKPDYRRGPPRLRAAP